MRENGGGDNSRIAFAKRTEVEGKTNNLYVPRQNAPVAGKAVAKQ